MPISVKTWSLRYAIDSKRFLYISSKAFETMSGYRQIRPHDLEATGILLGRRFVEHDHVVVDDVSIPQAKDQRRRHSVFRSAEHNRIAEDRWRASGRTQLYLGLWHTHPESHPTPSRVDYKDWQRALVHGHFEGNQLLFLIIGTQCIRCWAGEIRRKRWQIRAKTEFRELEWHEEDSVAD